MPELINEPSVAKLDFTDVGKRNLGNYHSSLSFLQVKFILIREIFEQIPKK